MNTSKSSSPSTFFRNLLRNFLILVLLRSTLIYGEKVIPSLHKRKRGRERNLLPSLRHNMVVLDTDEVNKPTCYKQLLWYGSTIISCAGTPKNQNEILLLLGQSLFSVLVIAIKFSNFVGIPNFFKALSKTFLFTASINIKKIEISYS